MEKKELRKLIKEEVIREKNNEINYFDLSVNDPSMPSYHPHYLEVDDIILKHFMKKPQFKNSLFKIGKIFYNYLLDKIDGIEYIHKAYTNCDDSKDGRTFNLDKLFKGDGHRGLYNINPKIDEWLSDLADYTDYSQEYIDEYGESFLLWSDFSCHLISEFIRFPLEFTKYIKGDKELTDLASKFFNSVEYDKYRWNIKKKKPIKYKLKNKSKIKYKIKENRMKKSVIREEILKEISSKTMIFSITGPVPLEKIKQKKIKYIGKTGRGYDSDYILNSNYGYVTTIWIDAENKADALTKLNNLKECEFSRNVYYYGNNAKSSIKNAYEKVENYI